MPRDVDEPTWFKLHDFTVTAADLALGTIIKHWNDPSTALFVPGDEEKDAIKWPKEHPTFAEAEHDWHDGSDRSSAANMLTKFFSTASFRTDVETQRRQNLTLGKVDLKVKKFVGVRPFSTAVLQTIVAQKAVDDYINSSSFRKKPVYVITALRLADKSFDVGKESSSAQHTKVSGSAEPPKAPVGFGASYSSDASKAADHSYKTAQGEGVGDGVVYAYQMYVIREERKQPTAALFSNKKGFMTGGDAPKTLEAVAVTESTEDLDSSLVEDVGDGEYLYVGSRTE